jgi:hypothetical protein
MTEGGGHVAGQANELGLRWVSWRAAATFLGGAKEAVGLT